MLKTKEIPLELPMQYRISSFPYSFDFFVPGFEKTYPLGKSKTLGLKKRDCDQWYNEFVDKLIDSCGRQFLPVCRMSDGEFLFLLGEQPIDIRLPIIQKLKQRLGRFKERLSLRGGVGPYTAGHYHSGIFSAKEWRIARIELPKVIRKLSEKGILALHLNYERDPFAERYYPALGKWLQENMIILNDNNYYPFYFVYALLTGPRRGELLKNRRLLIINGAKEGKRDRIVRSLKKEGVSEVLWCPISLMRSFYDSLDLKPFIGKVDLVIVGAGIGKFNILPQLEVLNVPCIDAGYIFEVWADSKNRWERTMCASDDDWEEEKRKVIVRSSQ